MSLRDSIADLMSHIRYDSSTREEALEVADEILSLPALKQKYEQTARMKQSIEEIMLRAEQGRDCIKDHFCYSRSQCQSIVDLCKQALVVNSKLQALSDTEGKE